MDDGNGGGLIAGGMMMMIMAVSFLIFLVCAAGLWKLFEKAGRPGWQGIVPFLNLWVLCEIIGFPGYYMLLVFVPFVGWLFAAYVYFKIPIAFGKDTMWGVLSIFFFPIVLLMLAFGDAQYQGSSSNAM